MLVGEEEWNYDKVSIVPTTMLIVLVALDVAPMVLAQIEPNG